MKFNKWTLGLAAVGVVSLASAARADEKVSALQTALSDTTISGYVSASFNWAITPGDYQNSPAGEIPFQGQTKENGFNLDVVKLSIAKPQDESPWAAGYQIDLLFGPDATHYNPSVNGAPTYYGGYGWTSDFSIKQAYVALRTPVGNGIDWKVGVFDTIIGYEVFDAGSNPNYTRSYGYAIEPTEHTGILGTYKINDLFTVSAGIANTLSPGINTRAYHSEYYYYYAQPNDWNKTFMGAVTFSAPSSWGWAAGSSLYAGVVYGFGGGVPTDDYYTGNPGYYASGNQVNYYAGAVLNTPLKQLTVGASFDYAHNLGGGYNSGGEAYHEDAWVLGAYATFKATDKLTVSGRAEYISWENYVDYTTGGGYHYGGDGYELTTTVDYALWANVVSRAELRWDHNDSYGDNKDSLGLYANIIYKF